MKYSRILLKLSGEALLGRNSYGIDNDRLVVFAEEIKQQKKQMNKNIEAILYNNNYHFVPELMYGCKKKLKLIIRFTRISFTNQ